MPDPNSVSPGAIGTRIDMSSAPGADLDWDSLFPNPEVQSASASQAPQGITPQSTPQVSQGPYLKAGDTVYNTREDAENGLAHKDSVVAKYRSFLQNQGYDPNALLKDEFVKPEPQVQTQQTTSQYKYFGNPNFFDEVAAAAQSRDKVKYEQLMAAHTQEAIQATLAPWRPTLTETTRYRAVRQVASEIGPDFLKFVDGPGLKKVQEAFPLYKDIEQVCENNPEAAGRLPEYYRSAYTLYQGMTLGQQPQQATAVTQTNPTVQQRPTLQNSSLTPPAPAVSSQGWQQTSWRGNKPLGNDARKQLIADGDNKFNGMRFEDVGL